jgi:EAL domain-containing protein (putative c-di-GMP-specific phosphodiesterase class I)
MTRRGAEVPAAELLAAAESSGLIVPLGEWVLREACAQAGQWRQAGLPAGVGLKVSPAQVVAPGFAESVLAALAVSGLPPAALTLEAAERDLVHGGGTALPGLAEVRAHGVRLAIGGFGTDYASLSYLRRRPVDVVTIDPEFVAGLGADAELAKLVEAIVRVGRDLGIEVVAAGITRRAAGPAARDGLPVRPGRAGRPRGGGPRDDGGGAPGPGGAARRAATRRAATRSIRLS